MFFDIQQNTDEWLDARMGLVTASKLSVVMANYGKAFGEPAKKYAVDIAIEQITGVRIESTFNNAHMDRGHEEEPLAIAEYERQFFSQVTNGGFFVNGSMGDSPDGLVGSDGCIEIKSAVPSVHYARVQRQSFDPAYKWQLVSHIMVCERDWCDFISYCSAYPDDKCLYVYRCTRDSFKEEMSQVNQRVNEFGELIKETKNNILNNNYSIT